jgi:hypothetical protein
MYNGSVVGRYLSLFTAVRLMSLLFRSSLYDDDSIFEMIDVALAR